MKYNLLLFVILFTASLPGQSRFSIDAFGGIGISQSPNSFLIEQGMKQNAVLVGRIGLGASIPVTGNFLFRTGIQITDYGFEIGDIIIPDINGQLVAEGAKFKSFTRTAEILLIARYELPTYHNIVPYAEGGLIVSRYINTRQVLIPNDSSEVVNEDPFREPASREVNAVGSLGAGVNFQVSPKFGLFYGMGFQLHLSSNVEDVPAKVRPWRLDTRIGVRYFPGG